MPNKITFKDVNLGGAAQPTREDVERLASNLTELISALRENEKFKSKTAIIDDLSTRLAQILERYNEALRLNDECLAGGIKGPWFDPEREAFVHEVDGKLVELLKLNRAHPDQPIKAEKVLKASIFVPGATPPDHMTSQPNKDAEIKLGAKVEDYYYSASRFWDVVEKDFLGKSNTKFIGVKMVRNRLLEHAEKGLSNSFGVTDRNGPIVKPARAAAAKETHFDPGLVLNMHELLEKSIAKLAN